MGNLEQSLVLNSIKLGRHLLLILSRFGCRKKFSERQAVLLGLPEPLPSPASPGSATAEPPAVLQGVSPAAPRAFG